jgi:hypothetical protein
MDVRSGAEDSHQDLREELKRVSANVRLTLSQILFYRIHQPTGIEINVGHVFRLYLRDSDNYRNGLATGVVSFTTEEIDEMLEKTYYTCILQYVVRARHRAEQN